MTWTPIVVDTAAMNRAASTVAQCVTDRPPVPELKGIALLSSPGRLTLLAGDYETAGRATVPTRPAPAGAGCCAEPGSARLRAGPAGDAVATAGHGQVLVEAHLLAAIVRHLPDPHLTLHVCKAHLVIHSGRATFRLLTMPVEDFPIARFIDLATADNHATKAKAAAPAPPWRTRPSAFWSRPSRRRVLFRPEPFRLGDWVWFADPWTGQIRIGQIWSDDAIVVPGPRDNQLLGLRRTRTRRRRSPAHEDPPQVLLSRQVTDPASKTAEEQRWTALRRTRQDPSLLAAAPVDGTKAA